MDPYENNEWGAYGTQGSGKEKDADSDEDDREYEFDDNGLHEVTSIHGDEDDMDVEGAGHRPRHDIDMNDLSSQEDSDADL